MPSDNHNENYDIRQLLLENQKLLADNNRILKKLHRSSVISFWLKIFWIAVVIGLPFVLYYFVIEPYFGVLGSSFDTFRMGLQEIPGWKQFYEAVQGRATGGGG
jgi:hypothetical protein